MSTSCVPRERALIMPGAPGLSAQAIGDSFMSGFHSGQVFTSDQTRQTSGGVAFVSRDASLNAIAFLLDGAERSSPLLVPKYVHVHPGEAAAGGQGLVYLVDGRRWRQRSPIPALHAHPWMPRSEIEPP